MYLFFIVLNRRQLDGNMNLYGAQHKNTTLARSSYKIYVCECDHRDTKKPKIFHIVFFSLFQCMAT